MQMCDLYVVANLLVVTSLPQCCNARLRLIPYNLHYKQPYRQQWIENVIQVDRQQVEKTSTASSGHCVACVVGVSPGIGA